MIYWKKTEEVIKTIADVLDIEYPNQYEEIKDKIRDFLDTSLKHHSKKNIENADYKFSFVKEAKELFEKLISRSIKDNNHIREKFDLLRNEFNSYAYEIELSELKSKNEELLNELIQTKEEKSQLEAKVQALETELTQQKSKNEELLNELVGVYLSKSWRITRPLRWLRRKLKI